MSRALVLDISFWNGAVDFAKMKAAGASAVICKASQQVADIRFKEYYALAKAAGLPRGAYHYLDWRISEITQAQLFCNLLKDDPGEFPPILDLEMEPTIPADQLRGRVWNFLMYVESVTGQVPMIYVGYYYWKAFGSPDAAWAKYPLWLPWYAPESVVKTPPPWTAWKLWQYMDNGNGPLYGSQGKEMDMNWYNGTEAEMLAWLKLAPPVVTPPPPTPIPPAANEYVVNTNCYLRKTDGTLDGIVYKGTIVKSTGEPVLGRVYIAYPDGQGTQKSGWVAAQFLTPLAGPQYKTCPQCGGLGKVPA